MIPAVQVPPGARGDWRVERFTIDRMGAAIFNVTNRGRSVSPGEYTRLMRGNVVVMSDTRAEVMDHYEPVRRARGRCLVNGLGLGMVVNAMLLKPEVTRVTVVELSADVIALTAPHYQRLYGDRLEVVHCAAIDYRPPKGIRYGAVWHDIWDYITADNLPAMIALHRKYGRRCDWQGSWARAECERNR